MIKTLIKSTRMTWASKNANMFLLALTYAYFSNAPIDNPLQILGGLVMVSVLWGALYTLNDLTDLAVKEKDHASQIFLQWFVKEQVEEEAHADEIVHKLEFIGEAGHGLYMIDRELGAREAD